MNLDEALDTFIIEARELLQAMEDALLGAGREGPDNDAVNAIFRAAHTIKGSAGLFGLDGIVAFTHVLESVLDRARGGELGFDSELISLLLACGDHLRTLVDRVSSGDIGTDEAERQLGAELVVKLGRYLGAAVVTQAAVRPEAASTQKEAVERPWHISVRFGPNVLRNGMDPLSFLNYLQTIGRIMRVEILTEGMPDAATMDPESCYVGFELALVTKAERAQIESVFEFVRDDCELRVLSPESTPADYADLIRALPEDDLRLGEILVRCGTLTQDELAHALGTQAMEPIGHARTIGEILVQEGVVDQGAVDAGLERQRQTRDRKGQENQTVRVDAQKLDLLIDLVGELVIAGSAVGVIGQKHKMAALTEAVSTLSRLVEGVRDRALQLRMVQIGATFNRFKRVVHDVSQELGKDIELVISGEETELDKTVVEQIADPLTHLVRNAIDHGIESADARKAAGKPVRGTLRLNAFHDSGSIVIEVSDDGGGLRRDRILAKAVERGLVNPGATLSDSEVYGLVFEPGFSTAAAVTNLSGRGVGMDVVKRNVTALRGTIEIDSKEGQGSRFSVRLPLTLAIIDGFLVRLGNATFVVPLDIVDECVELPPENIAGGAGRDYVNLRGQVLPFLRLREVFGADGEPAKRQNIVVVKHANRRLGLVVDELLGEAQTVIKPLGRLFQGLSGISGSTILGDGRVALIVDVPTLAQDVEARESGALSSSRRADTVAAA